VLADESTDARGGARRRLRRVPKPFAGWTARAICAIRSTIPVADEPHELPHVTLHFAQSLDGRIAFPRARARLSSPEGIVLAHRARAANDAVLVGSRTVHVDDPRLTVRACDGRQPRRIVLASGLDVPASARVFERGPGLLVIGARGRAAPDAVARLTAAGAQVRVVDATPDGLVSLPAALDAIRAWGVARLLVEGGARILTAFLRERLAASATVEIAPRWLGEPGLVALGAIGAGAKDASASTVALAETHVDRAGESVVVRGRVVY